jgi:NTE family protein
MPGSAATDPAPKRPRRALVLSGGGARGAYEAGVLRYLFEALPRRLGHAPRIDIVSGTSVGAIHACFVAATAHLAGDARGERLQSVWESLALGDLFGSVAGEVLRLPRRLIGALRSSRALRGEKPPDRLYGLLNTEHLERIVVDAIPWKEIGRNIKAGRIDAACVAATEIATGRGVVFVQTHASEDAPWEHDPSVVARATRLGPAHALASAAIPVLFPAVRIGDTYFADGGLRVNTPLSSVLRLGADRVLVVALRKGAAGGREGDRQARRVASYGNPLFLFGKVLNALLLDHIDNDLAHLRMLNDVVRHVRDAGGESVVARMNEIVTAERGQPLRVIEDHVVRPSQDLGVMAGETLHGIGGREQPSLAVRLLLRALDLGDAPFEADLLSYVLFDGSYTRRLIALGYEDARLQEDELAAFFSD